MVLGAKLQKDDNLLTALDTQRRTSYAHTDLFHSYMKLHIDAL